MVKEEGDGPLPQPGQNITADYSLWFSNGTLLETTQGGPPATFPIGEGHLVRAAAAAACSTAPGALQRARRSTPAVCAPSPPANRPPQIRSWDEGLQLVPVGSTVLMVARPEFAYGNRSDSGLPPDTTLVFEITLLDAEGA